MNSYIFNIKNFNHFDEIDISLNHINVVLGKSKKIKPIISKLIYCCLQATSNKTIKLLNLNIMARLISLCYKFENEFSCQFYGSFTNISIYNNHFDEIIKSKLDLLKILAEINKSKIKSSLINAIENFGEYISLNMDDNNWYWNYLNMLIDEELGHKFFNINSNSSIYFHGNVGDYNYKFSYSSGNFSIKMDKNNINQFDFNNVIYLDSIPPIIQDNKCRYYNHCSHLDNILSIPSDERIKEYNEDFNELLEGFSIHGESIYKCKFIKDRNIYSLYNVPLQVRLIGLFNLLIENNHLKDSFLILDEFDKYLNSDNIFKFTKLLIVLSLKLNIHLWINTTNSRFINALNYYLDRYNVKDKVNFYSINHRSFKLLNK